MKGSKDGGSGGKGFEVCWIPQDRPPLQNLPG